MLLYPAPFLLLGTQPQPTVSFSPTHELRTTLHLPGTKVRDSSELRGLSRPCCSPSGSAFSLSSCPLVFRITTVVCSFFLTPAPKHLSKQKELQFETPALELVKVVEAHGFYTLLGKMELRRYKATITQRRALKKILTPTPSLSQRGTTSQAVQTQSLENSPLLDIKEHPLSSWSVLCGLLEGNHIHMHVSDSTSGVRVLSKYHVT